MMGAGVLGLALAGWAQEEAGSRREAFTRKHHQGRMDQLTKDLGLSESQTAEVKALRERDDAASRDRWTKERALNDELEKLIAAPEPDRGAIAEKTKAILELRSQAFETHVEQRLAFRQILTPEQRTKLDATKAEHRLFGDRGMRHRLGRRHGYKPAPTETPQQ